MVFEEDGGNLELSGSTTTLDVVTDTIFFMCTSSGDWTEIAFMDET